MINRRQWILLAGSLSTLPFGRIGGAFAANSDEAAKVRKAVDEAVRPLLAQHGIPGMAVGVTLAGRRHFVEYGSASPQQKIPVTRDTLFELGSISKTFTATLAALAEVEGQLKLTDTVGRHMPELAGSPIGAVRLVDLGTHTAGGFPLQLPDEVKSEAQLIAWYRAWKPKYAAGTMRVYANPSVALLGIATARAMGESFNVLAGERLFRPLGLEHTFVNLVDSKAYAWGTNKDGKAVRAGFGPISAEAWGVVSNSTDMLRYLEVQMGLAQDVSQPLAQAVAATHTGYYRSGPFVQDLIWEQYQTPATLDDMTRGNSSGVMGANPNPATAILPPMPPRADVILNKTGSTGGFGAYVFCAPEKKLGIVLLANKFYPNEARTKAAWRVMETLAG
ncbi:class C beta-lactamase [Dongia sedimenti]|uniref:Beta-lactamase n=1 Tax=Dongia sedimenti TaxID=3064282 RepID=A0ABU0YLZ1_9PROT|nr:class C beta-lactamase [Rhodospirillaceae bacterium R-7]